MRSTRKCAVRWITKWWETRGIVQATVELHEDGSGVFYADERGFTTFISRRNAFESETAAKAFVHQKAGKRIQSLKAKIAELERRRLTEWSSASPFAC